MLLGLFQTIKRNIRYHFQKAVDRTLKLNLLPYQSVDGTSYLSEGAWRTWKQFHTLKEFSQFGWENWFGQKIVEGIFMSCWDKSPRTVWNLNVFLFFIHSSTAKWKKGTVLFHLQVKILFLFSTSFPISAIISEDSDFFSAPFSNGTNKKSPWFLL